MKHVRTISRPAVQQAQMSTEEIIGLVIAILSAVASILAAVIPLTTDKS